MTEPSRARTTAALSLIALISLGFGYLLFSAIKFAIDYLWGAAGPWSGKPPVPFILTLPVIAGVLVWGIRSRWQDGHNPLAGLALGPVAPRDYPSLVGAVLVSLLGGLVLGPEVALLFTGSVIGTALGPRLGVAAKTAALAGGGGALIALFIGPAFAGSAGPGYTYAAGDLVAAGIAALAACALIAFARLIGLAGPRDRVSGLWLVGGGAAVGVIAAAYQTVSGESAQLVLTSGEQMIKPLLALDTTSLIAATVAVKMVAYGLSMAAGFRGGPYFPAMFAGAGAGAVAAAMLAAAPDAAVTAGIVAAVTYLAHANWKFTLILGLILGFLVGGWELAPVGLVAAAIGRAIPRPDPPRTVTTAT